MTTQTQEAPTKAQILEGEIRFMISCGEGENAILAALGYRHKAKSLKRHLSRHGLHDLIPRIFEWDALYRETSNR